MLDDRMRKSLQVVWDYCDANPDDPRTIRFRKAEADMKAAVDRLDDVVRQVGLTDDD